MKIKNLLYRLNIVFVIGCIFLTFDAKSQNDSIVFKNSNLIVGELKTMKQDVATVKTDFSDSDFKIKWDEITSIKTISEFLITLSAGDRFNGVLRSDGDKVLILDKNDNVLIETTFNNIVALELIKSEFWSRFEASVSVGYNFIKSDNQSQLSLRSNFSYKAKRWILSSNYNQIDTQRDDVSAVRRLESAVNFTYYLKKNWFALTELSFFTNTEQNIQLRTLGKLGIGKYILRNNKYYWGLQGGVLFNNETFLVSGSESNNNSVEGFFGTEFNVYNVGDFSLLTRAVAYPSLTEKGRFRFDYGFDLKYDLPLNFYIKLGLTLNHDNQPVQTTNKTDYVFQTTLGWDL